MRTVAALASWTVAKERHCCWLVVADETALVITLADALVGADFLTFRFSRTDITSRFSLFPSLTTPGRMRMQANSDLRIKIVKDLWWGFHLYENYDSKPPVRADKNDLGVSTSIGWKF